MADSPALKRDFDHILKHLRDEDYDRCTSAALHFIRTHNGPEAVRYTTYAEFFKLFADAYHTWQGSYHYTPIRGLFRLAASRLQNAPHARDHDLVVEGLNKLCEMLLAYTRCENSIINNDPFALKDYSQTAINLEEAGLSRLHDFSSPESYLEDIADWLRGYLEKNRYLHTGLNACAQIYAHIMRDRGCPEVLFHEQIRRAEEALDKLTQISPELSSELNAHIRHTREHYRRLAGKSPTFLRVRSGKLVLSLTAACDRAGVRRILQAPGLEQFKHGVKTQLNKRGLGVDDESFRPNQLMDIFETSFGESFLKSLTFDIEPDSVAITFLRDRIFKFKTRVTLSALGTCTVAFELEIDEGEFENGISVEEIRVLESCICPHAGQVKVEIARTGKPPASPANFFDRVNIVSLSNALADLESKAERARDEKLTEKINAVTVELEDHRQNSLMEAHGTTAVDREARCETLCGLLNDVIERVEDERDLKELLHCCHDHTQLSGLAEEILAAIGQAFCATTLPNGRRRIGMIPNEEIWLLRPDLGWYAYLYAKRIDEVTTALDPLKQSASFPGIQDHPDTVGLVIDQREARASFDDWRFMTLKVSEKDNLAHVRSHASDAFYTSEFQTFFYFPDDPQYLVDQYEETVKINLRLNIGLSFYNWMAERLTYQIRKDEDSSTPKQKARGLKQDRKPEQSFRLRNALQKLDPRKLPGIKQVHGWGQRFWRDKKRIHDLERDLERVRRLRSEANELRNLVLKAGISRYQDHGKLMKRILDKMNVETSAAITDRHLGQLEQLSLDIIEQLRALRRRWFIIAGSLIAASVTRDFFEAVFGHEHRWIVLIGMASVLVALITIGLIIGKPPSEK